MAAELNLEAVLKDNEGLVWTIAKQYFPSVAFDRDDIRQECRRALLSAAESFDPQLGKWITHAGYAMRTRVSKMVLKNTRRAKRAPMKSIYYRLNGEPESTFTLLDIIPAPDEDGTGEGVCELLRAINRLPKRTQSVVRGVYLEGLSPQQMGDMLDISEVRVRSILEHGIMILRKELV
jgi:RNA polymerase sigma factor (sigma-70 family)